MSNFSNVEGALYGVGGDEVDINVRFGEHIHNINPNSISLRYDFSLGTIRCEIIESKLVACKLQLLSLINRYGGICDISLTTSMEFTTPGLLLMELRGCTVLDMNMNIDPTNTITAKYELTVGSMFDVGDPAPWDSSSGDPNHFSQDTYEKADDQVQTEISDIQLRGDSDGDSVSLT